MSLIADSLKKAVKEKSVPPWDPSREVNLVGKRDPLKHPGLWSVFRVGLLIVIPAAILIYLISTGAFDLKKTPVAQKPGLPLAVPLEEAKALSAPEVPSEKTISKAPLTEPSPEPEVVNTPVLDEKAVPSEASSLTKKEETASKKVLPPYPLKKNFKKPEQASGVQEKKQEVVAPASLAAKPEVPENLAKGPEENAVKVVPKELSQKPLADEPPIVETKPGVPETLPAVKPSAEITPETEIAKKEEIQLKPSEKEAMEVLPAVKPAEEKILEPEIAKQEEIPAKPVDKPVVAETAPPALPELAPGKTDKPRDLAVTVQKEERETASLPSSGLKPEISRIDPSIQEDVFQNSDFYFNRAIFFQQAKDWEKALDNYVKAEQLDPNNPDTYNNKGVIYKEQGKFDKALDEFLRAIFLDPKYAKAYNNIGVVYFMQENYSEGIRNYLKAIDLNPSNLEAFNNLAIIYKKQNDLEKARAVLNQALAMNPDHPGTNYNLAVLYEENREITPALHFYRRFIELGTIGYPSLVNQVKKHVETLKPQ